MCKGWIGHIKRMSFACSYLGAYKMRDTLVDARGGHDNGNFVEYEGVVPTMRWCPRLPPVILFPVIPPSFSYLFLCYVSSFCFHSYFPSARQGGAQGETHP